MVLFPVWASNCELGWPAFGRHHDLLGLRLVLKGKLGGVKASPHKGRVYANLGPRAVKRSFSALATGLNANRYWQHSSI